MSIRALDAEDLLDDVKNIVECLWMAAGSVEDSRKTDAIQATATCALDKIEDVKEAFKKARAEAR